MTTQFVMFSHFHVITTLWEGEGMSRSTTETFSVLLNLSQVSHGRWVSGLVLRGLMERKRTWAWSTLTDKRDTNVIYAKTRPLNTQNLWTGWLTPSKLYTNCLHVFSLGNVGCLRYWCRTAAGLQAHSVSDHVTRTDIGQSEFNVEFNNRFVERTWRTRHSSKI